VAAIELAPIIVFAFLGGALAHWADRRTAVITCQALTGGNCPGRARL
jgi:hypothetical protein